MILITQEFTQFYISIAVIDRYHGGLVVGSPTAVREDPGSNLAAAGRVYHDSHCDIQPWARVVHLYCSA